MADDKVYAKLREIARGFTGKVYIPRATLPRGECPLCDAGFIATILQSEPRPGPITIRVAKSRAPRPEALSLTYDPARGILEDE